MVNLHSHKHEEPEEPNTHYCLCINSSCSKTKRPLSEITCGNCGSNLILNNRYRVMDIIILEKRHQVEQYTFYDAVDIIDNEKSKVIKVLHTVNQEEILRFERSADVLTKNWFEGIPKVDKGGYFQIRFANDPIPASCLVMEKIEGKNLQQWLKIPSNQPLNDQQTIDWLKKLTIILGRLHYQDFIHQDINPSNIILRDNGGDIFLINFNAARPINQAVSNKKSVTIIGTDGYIPPEQRKGRTIIQSDFYALGMTFVHLLTGKHPNEFEEDRNKKLRWRYSAPQISPLLAEFIDKLIAKSSKDRPRNTQEILDKIAEIELKLEHQAKVNKWLNFYLKKIIGLIVFVLLGIVFRFGIIHSNKPQPPSLSDGNPPTSQSNIAENNRLCRIQKDGQFNVNAISNAANQAIEFATDQNNPSYINIPRNRFVIKGQSGCKVIIVYLGKEEDFTLEQKALIKKYTEENMYPDAVQLLDVDFQIL
jgi:serine/threonine protein kinase